MARSRLPRWRSISQIFFLLLFLSLLFFTSLSFFPGGSTEIHLSAPVRLFFEWDPLVALVNALAGHALYRGLIWSLIILAPTLFLGRFFCGWICPMGTLQHFVGNMPSEAKRGKQRIDQGHQWVPFKEEAHGSAQMYFGSTAGKKAQRGEKQQPEEEQQKEYLRNPAPPRQSGPNHESPSRCANATRTG